MVQPNASVRSRTRAAIVEAAASIFQEVGFEGASMDAIARRANVARATLYYNFRSKDDIAVGVAESHRAEGYARLVERRATGVDALTLLDEFFAFAGEWVARNRDAAFIGTTAAIRGVGRAPERPGTTTVFEQLVAQGQQEGSLRDDLDPAVAARLLGALLTQAALLGPDASDADATQWPRRLLRLTLEGLRAPGSDPPRHRPDMEDDDEGASAAIQSRGVAR